MKTRTTKHPAATVGGVPAPVDASLLEKLFDQAPDVAFFIKDAAGRYLAVNASLVERHGLRHKSQVLGQRPCDICPGDYERRWRAAQMAGLSQVPVLVRKVADNAALAMALIENIQREDLSSLEEAYGIQRLIDEFKMTHQTAADAVGRSRSAASNLLRLIKLPQPVQAMLMNGELEMGHARALLALGGAQQIAAANKIVAQKLSVREAEKLVQQLLNPEPKHKKAKPSRDILHLQEEVAQRMGTSVQIKPGKKGAGKLIIDYTSHDHLDELIKRWR